MGNQIMGHRMRHLAELISEEIPELGFVLITFEFHKPGISNYISNADRRDMKKLPKETLERWERQEDFPTPEEN